MANAFVLLHGWERYLTLKTKKGKDVMHVFLKYSLVK